MLWFGSIGFAPPISPCSPFTILTTSFLPLSVGSRSSGGQPKVGSAENKIKRLFPGHENRNLMFLSHVLAPLAYPPPAPHPASYPFSLPHVLGNSL
uniref:Uncharacterized protein n=1 Tax=Picea glauca TaxID=3330 RepID=A0A101LWE9_PICGL|nr:hypothetical protein ABT39_MTgene1679 [Picea glauca]